MIAGWWKRKMMNMMGMMGMMGMMNMMGMMGRVHSFITITIVCIIYMG